MYSHHSNNNEGANGSSGKLRLASSDPDLSCYSNNGIKDQVIKIFISEDCERTLNVNQVKRFQYFCFFMRAKYYKCSIAVCIIKE